MALACDDQLAAWFHKHMLELLTGNVEGRGSVMTAALLTTLLGAVNPENSAFSLRVICLSVSIPVSYTHLRAHET